jgi:hypothetical protein
LVSADNRTSSDPEEPSWGSKESGVVDGSGVFDGSGIVDVSGVVDGSGDFEGVFEFDLFMASNRPAGNFTSQRG